MSRPNIDSFISQFDLALRAVTGHSAAGKRPSPAEALPEAELGHADRREAGRLMRVNHCGEVCAQALYMGQALSSRDRRTADAMQEAAKEEQDHLAWCEARLKELDTPVSRLNPLFFGASFAAGYAAGLLGDKVNLGFVAATEEKVVEHLEAYIAKLPEQDERSRAILEQMKQDENQHRVSALGQGGRELPAPLKGAMTLLGRLMSRSTYWV